MKEQTYFHIPEPCHENWNNMTQQDKGRFCASCSKQVVDFSLMSDQQVLNYFKNTTGKTCGRFANDQLQRPMVELPKHKKKAWWIAAMMPLLLVFGKASAQKKNVTKGKVCNTTTSQQSQMIGMVLPKIDTTNITSPAAANKMYKTFILGDTQMSSDQGFLTIKGRITEENSEYPLVGASVVVKGSNIGCATEANGDFTLHLKQERTLPVLEISYVGYQSREINLNKDEAEIIYSINKTENFEEITLKSEMIKMKEQVMGGIGVVVVSKRIKHLDSAKTTLKKILNTQDFKIFPNPIQKGSVLKIEIKKKGEYSIQILNNNGALTLVQDVLNNNENSLHDITIPSYITPGLYYVRLIDNNSKKQYTDKLIVQ